MGGHVKGSIKLIYADTGGLVNRKHIPRGRKLSRLKRISPFFVTITNYPSLGNLIKKNLFSLQLWRLKGMALTSAWFQ